MRYREEKWMRVLQYILGGMMAVTLLFLVLGQIFLPDENPPMEGGCVLYGAQWKRVHDNGSWEEVKLPAECDAKRGEAVRIETTLAEDQKNTWLCLRASQQDMKIYVGDELRVEYTTKNTRPFGVNSASAYVFVPLYAEDAGKVLAVETVSDSMYSGVLNEIYVGDKYDIRSHFLGQYSLVLILSLFMFVLSLITVVYSAILHRAFKMNMEISHLGWGLLLASLWLFANSRVRQFILPNSSVSSAIGFMVVMLLPYPYLVYINLVQKGRYQKFYMAIAVCTIVNFSVSVLLQVLNIKDFLDTMLTSHIIIGLLVLLCVVTMIMDARSGKMNEYREVGFGFVGLTISAVWEIYLVYRPTSTYSGLALCLGLTFLLFTAAWKTGQDLLRIENEKQMAIVAGESKAKFLANMSHEIRTPINTIIGMNEMILRENEDETIAEYANDIQDSSHLLLGLINDILDFSKIEAGKLDIIPTDYHVSKMLAGVIQGVCFKTENRDLEITYDIDETLPSVLRGDEIRVRQILNNLLNNAVKYTREGTITLTAKGEYASGGFELVMAVEDTGIGIRKEDIPHLFDSFQRLEEKKNRHIEGTGLGLNITKQLVDLMGGSIEVTSVYGKGSCFTVRIPQQIVNGVAIGAFDGAAYSKGEQKSSKESELKAVLYAPTARILAVDDTKMNLSVVKALLKRTGICLDIASSGKECLALCKENQYDLILMDHMMPELDGIETLHLLREGEGGLNQKTKVIVLTANAISGVREMYLAEGFTDYLAKPLVGEELEQMIKNYLPKEKLEKSAEQIAYEQEAVRKAEEKKEEKKQQALSAAVAKTLESKFATTEDPLFVIDKESAMRYSVGDEELYKEVVNEYCNQETEYYEKLKQYYEQRDWNNFRIIAHAIKGASLLVGANAFSEKSKEMEFACREEKEEYLLTEGPAYIENYRKLVEMMK